MSPCTGKQAFASPTLAREAASRKKARAVYRCGDCGKWHVGTSALGKRDKRRELRERAERYMSRVELARV